VKLVATKVAALVAVLAAVTFCTSLLLSLFQGDIVCTLLQTNCVDEARAEQVRDDLRLDDPVPVRWLGWLDDARQGDLGISYVSGQEVGGLISDRAPVSVAIVVYAQVLALAVAVPLGILAAHRQGGRLDRAINTVAFGFLALPSFILGPVLILVFPFGIGLFRATVDGDVGPLDIDQLFLPALTLALGQVAVYLRLLRTDMISTLQEDFIGVAKAKGMPVRSILFDHAFRPSSLNLLTTVGISFGSLIAGAVVVETIFGIGGLGSILTGAVQQRDLLLVQGIVAVVAVAFVVINFVIDLLYTFLDPRIRSAA